MRLRALVLALALLLLSSDSAAARPQGEPVRLWSISNIRQGVGVREVTGGGQIGGVLDKTVDLGPAVFNFPGTPRFDRSVANVFSSADGTRYSVLAQAPSLNPFQPRSPKGSVSHLDELQAYEKRSGDASLTISITDAVLHAIDDNGRLGPNECPRVPRCPPIRASVEFHARAYAASAGGDFFNVGGTAYVEGHQLAWAFDAVTSSDSSHPLWSSDDFDQNDDLDGSETGGEFFAGFKLRQRSHHLRPVPIRLRVPLDSVREGELFGVHVSLDATTVDERGRESAAEAFIQDPQHEGPALLATRGLRRGGKPRFREPKIEPPRPARCPPAGRKGRGRCSSAHRRSLPARAPARRWCSSPAPAGPAAAPAPSSVRALARRRRASDFKQRSTRVRFAGGDTLAAAGRDPDPRGPQGRAPREADGHPRAGALRQAGGRRRATVTILDDDQPPPPPSRLHGRRQRRRAPGFRTGARGPRRRTSR